MSGILKSLIKIPDYFSNPHIGDGLGIKESGTPQKERAACVVSTSRSLEADQNLMLGPALPPPRFLKKTTPTMTRPTIGPMTQADIALSSETEFTSLQ
jgi:hypothetical protein